VLAFTSVTYISYKKLLAVILGKKKKACGASNTKKNEQAINV